MKSPRLLVTCHSNPSILHSIYHHVSTRNPGSICSSLPGLDRFIHLRGRPGDAWRLHLRPDAAVHHRWQRGAAATRGGEGRDLVSEPKTWGVKNGVHQENPRNSDCEG